MINREAAKKKGRTFPSLNWLKMYQGPVPLVEPHPGLPASFFNNWLAEGWQQNLQSDSPQTSATLEGTTQDIISDGLTQVMRKFLFFNYALLTRLAHSILDATIPHYHSQLTYFRS